MKIRTGFVSNSSSSSFIVVFDAKPKNRKELQNVLFGPRKEFQHPYDIEEYYSTDFIAQIVWDDMKDQTCMTMAEIANACSEGYLDIAGHMDIDTCMTSLMLGMDQETLESKITGKPKHPEYTDDKKLYEKQRKEYDRLMKIWAIDQAKKWFGNFVEEKKFICKFSYSDNDGAMGSAMEHGDLFHNTKHHMRISHH